MKTSHLILISLIALASVSFIAGLFMVNLPNWCANPNGNGNWIVQPICK